jgi:hypothetical protein
MAVDRALSYQETLRTLGTLLDWAETDAATIELSAQGAEVSVPTWRGPRVWDWDELRAEAARQRNWRNLREAGCEPAWARRISRELRTMGWMLDAQPAGAYYTVELAPETIQVRVQDDVHTFVRVAAGTAHAHPG